MKVVVTGAAGFLGSRVADVLLAKDSPIPVTKLTLTDVVLPQPRRDQRVYNVALDLADPSTADKLIDADCDVFFHLAAVVSGQAEAEFDFGFKANFDATRVLLETIRSKVPTAKFVFVSTCAVFGGDLPPVLDDLTAVMPQTSYGTAKAMCELLVNDYSRRGFLDGRIVRLPAVTVRPGTANAALTSFVSGIIREPLNGVEAICPVAPEQVLWLTSPATVVKNIIHAGCVPTGALGKWRVVNLPGMCVTVGDMVAALKEIAGEKVAALVKFEYDEFIARVIASLPAKIDNTRPLKLGFTVDKNFADVIRSYIKDYLKK